MRTQCSEVRANLDRFLDGDLPDPERARFAAHIEACPECREELQSERQAMEAIEGLPRLTCPDHVIRRLEKTVAVQDRGPSFAERFGDLIKGLRWRPLAAALPIAAAALLLVLLRPGENTPGSAPYSDEEIRKAEKQATWTLTFVAQTINSAQEKTVEELVRESLRSMIRTRLRDAVQRTEGDQS
jgi:anti-sigma factor (TIGR02949 family)